MSFTDYPDPPLSFTSHTPASDISHQSPQLYPRIFPLFNSLMQSPEYLEALEKSYSAEKSTYYSSYKQRKGHTTHRRRSERKETPSRSAAAATKEKETGEDVRSTRKSSTSSSIPPDSRPRPSGRNSWIDVQTGGRVAEDGRQDSLRAKRHIFSNDVFSMGEESAPPLPQMSASAPATRRSSLINPLPTKPLPEAPHTPPFNSLVDSSIFQPTRPSLAARQSSPSSPTQASRRKKSDVPFNRTSESTVSLPLSTRSVSTTRTTLTEAVKSLGRIFSRSSHRHPGSPRPQSSYSRGTSSLGPRSTVDDEDDKSTTSSWFTSHTSLASEPLRSTMATHASTPTNSIKPKRPPLCIPFVSDSRPARRSSADDYFPALDRTVSLPAPPSEAVEGPVHQGAYRSYGGRIEWVYQNGSAKKGKKSSWKKWRSWRRDESVRPASALA